MTLGLRSTPPLLNVVSAEPAQQHQTCLGLGGLAPASALTYQHQHEQESTLTLGVHLEACLPVWYSVAESTRLANVSKFSEKSRWLRSCEGTGTLRPVLIFRQIPRATAKPVSHVTPTSSILYGLFWLVFTGLSSSISQYLQQQTVLIGCKNMQRRACTCRRKHMLWTSAHCIPKEGAM